MKKVVVILIVLGLMGGAWVFWRYSVDSQNEAATEASEGNSNGSAKIEYLTSSPVISPVLAYDELSVWYFDNLGRDLLRQHVQDRNDIKLYPLPEHSDVHFAIWPDTGSDLVIATSEGRFLYDSLAQRFIPYPDEIKYLNWLPGGQRVAYIWSDETGNTFSVARPNITDHRVIANLPHANFRFSVSPNGRSFVFYTPEGSSPLFLLIDGVGVLEPLGENQKVYTAKFSPDGKLVALIADKDGLVQLGVLNLVTREYRALGEAFMGGDFVWSNGGQSLYWSGSDGEIWQTNLVNNERQNLLASMGVDVTTKQLLLSKDESAIYFVEAETSRLGRIYIDK